MHEKLSIGYAEGNDLMVVILKTPPRGGFNAKIRAIFCDGKRRKGVCSTISALAGRRLLALGLVFAALAGCICVGATLLELPVAPFINSGINTGIFRKNSMISRGGRQLIAYFAADGRIALIERSLKADEPSKVFLVESEMPVDMLGDGHQAVNMGLDSNDRVHLIWGCHDTASPGYAKLRWDGDGIVLENRSNVLPFRSAQRISYPQFYGSFDQLFLFFRRDCSRAGKESYDQCFWSYDAARQTWAAMYEPLVAFPEPPRLAYFNTMGERGSTLALAYTIRRYDLMDRSDPAMRVMNESIRIIKSEDRGRHWCNLAGKVLPSPIQALAIDPSISIPPDQNLVNQGGGCLDGSRQFRISYFQNDENGIPQIFLTSVGLDDGMCQTEILTHRVEPFNMLGRGTQVWPISRPVVLCLGKTVLVIYREDARLMAQVKTDAGWEELVLYAGPLGNYEPIVDYTALSSGRLSLYLQYSMQGRDDRSASELASDLLYGAYVLDVSEREVYAALPCGVLPYVATKVR
jgi:hypothetical protein